MEKRRRRRKRLRGVGVGFGGDVHNIAQMLLSGVPTKWKSTKLWSTVCLVS